MIVCQSVLIMYPNLGYFKAVSLQLKVSIKASLCLEDENESSFQLVAYISITVLVIWKKDHCAEGLFNPIAQEGHY